jgi:lipoyl(octanoyl) transferase
MLEFLFSRFPVPYEEAMDFMEKRVERIFNDAEKELIWFLEHENILTLGTSADEKDLLTDSIPSIKTNRGGKITLHSPGQRICYVMLNLKERSNGTPDPKKFVKMLENIVIEALFEFGIKGETKEGRVGIWVETNGREEKIGAIGLRFKKGITMHGFAVNINNDLSLFKNIIPCGIANYGVCSIKSLGYEITLSEFDAALKEKILQHIT